MKFDVDNLTADRTSARVDWNSDNLEEHAYNIEKSLGLFVEANRLL